MAKYFQCSISHLFHRFSPQNLSDCGCQTQNSSTFVQVFVLFLSNAWRTSNVRAERLILRLTQGEDWKKNVSIQRYLERNPNLDGMDTTVNIFKSSISFGTFGAKFIRLPYTLDKSDFLSRSIPDC